MRLAAALVVALAALAGAAPAAEDPTAVEADADTPPPAEQPSETETTAMTTQWQTPKFIVNEALNADGSVNKEGEYKKKYCEAQAAKRRACVLRRKGAEACARRHRCKDDE